LSPPFFPNNRRLTTIRLVSMRPGAMLDFGALFTELAAQR
jgi:hypothetical protein